ncbi:MAG: hypothetical protein JNM10_01995 [Planctomycetia bacterium]|nr:hypothetical protein [Planctomycetia bacterium]
MRPPEMLADMLLSAPTSPSRREARWASVVRALAEVYPELAGAPGELFDDARMLRVAFDLVDALVFHASFRALWDVGDRPLWAWRLETGDAPCDAWLEEEEVEDSRDAGDDWQQAPEIVYEFVLHGPRLAEAFPGRTDGAGAGGALPTGRFDDEDSPSVLVAVVRALGRRMVRLAARHGSYDDREADTAERLLVEAFGQGPTTDPLRPPAPPRSGTPGTPGAPGTVGTAAPPSTPRDLAESGPAAPADAEPSPRRAWREQQRTAPPHEHHGPAGPPPEEMFPHPLPPGPPLPGAHPSGVHPSRRITRRRPDDGTSPTGASA